MSTIYDDDDHNNNNNNNNSSSNNNNKQNSLLKSYKNLIRTTHKTSVKYFRQNPFTIQNSKLLIKN